MTDTLPRLRSDLVVHVEGGSPQPVYIIKDPLTGRFFRLRAPEHYLLTRADGQISLAEAIRQTEERFNIQLGHEAAAAFFARMERLLFFEGPAIERVTGQLARTVRGRRRASVWTIPIAAFDPDRLLTRWLPVLRLMFRPLTVATALIVMAGATLTLTAQGTAWRLGSAGLWHFASIPMLLAAIGVIAYVHEFGHALTLKYYGGSVHEMGFLLLYFQPCVYSNISDSYLLPRRNWRLHVGLAGLFFQGLLTAVAILLWRLLEPATAASHFLQVLVTVSLALVLFNLNPLIKLDGYYLLVDWLRMPNLRARAFAHWRGILRRWIIGGADVASPAAPRARRIYFWYGLFAALYTTALVGVILYHATLLAYAHWGGAGVVILYALIGILAFTALAPSGSATSEDDRGAEVTTHPRRSRKPLFFWSTLVVIIVLSAIIRLERRVGSACEVEAVSRYTVTSPTGGTLEATLYVGGTSGNGRPTTRRERSVLQATTSEFSVVAYDLRVREGDSVHVGDTLVVMSSNRYRAQLATRIAEQNRTRAELNLLFSGPKKDAVLELRAQLAEAQAQLENRELELERGRRMYERNLISEAELQAKRADMEKAKAQKDAKNSALALLISEPKAEEIAVKEAEIAALDSQIDFLRAQIAASTLIAPIDGIVTRVERTGILVEVADLDPVRLQLWVDENDIADVRAGAPVALKVRPLPFTQFRGRVAEIAADADTIGSRRRFLVTTEISNLENILKPGMSGYAKIACGRRPILALLARRVIQFFRVEFWSWW
ncbi:MAG: efflux RND transporter periplasmic adaptor subunit [Candidatus Zixiibacteriota bacterium]